MKDVVVIVSDDVTFRLQTAGGYYYASKSSYFSTYCWRARLRPGFSLWLMKWKQLKWGIFKFFFSIPSLLSILLSVLEIPVCSSSRFYRGVQNFLLLEVANRNVRLSLSSMSRRSKFRQFFILMLPSIVEYASYLKWQCSPNRNDSHNGKQKQSRILQSIIVTTTTTTTTNQTTSNPYYIILYYIYYIYFYYWSIALI
jgi:hypothetical protein